MSQRTSEMLVEKVQKGLPLEVARDSTILEIGLKIGALLAQRSLPDILTSFGLEESLAPKIFNLAATKSMQHLAEAFMVVVGGGGAAGIPTPSCLRRHLPEGRDPTDEEMEEAIAACRREAQAKV
ncbi:MAG TPA: hypothetical protein VHW09_10360 [Bryobacteraceae bacterium]|jgi:hypothetical protein|nr:hypothetical protein [Bryobacteraceae bacterium]